MINRKPLLIISQVLNNGWYASVTVADTEKIIDTILNQLIEYL